MKLKVFVLATALVLLAGPAVAADRSTKAKSAPAGTGTRIPPAPATQPLQIPPAPAARAVPPAAAKTAETPTGVIVAESRPYISKGSTVQHFVDYINLKPGQEKLPLTLTLSNNGYSWVNVAIGGYPVVSRKDIRNKVVVPVDVSGNIGGGSSQVLVDAVGPPGAKLTWKLTAPSPEVKAVAPDTVNSGDTLTIEGKHFCPVANYNTVMIGDKAAPVTAATTSRLEVKVPDGATSGLQKVAVLVTGKKALGKAEVTVGNAAPELSSMSLMSGPPGQEVTIYGKNFSKNLGENKVFFGDTNAEVEAPVVSGDPQSLTVVVPQMTSPLYNVPVTVKVGKIKSKNSLDFMVQSRVF